MHEYSLMKDLFNKIDEIAKNNNAQEVTKVYIEIGALAHISPAHFKEHFDEMREQSCAKNADVIINENKDIHHPRAQDITLLRIEVAEE